MKHACRPFQSSVAGLLEDFLRHHRALGKRLAQTQRRARARRGEHADNHSP